MTAHPSQLRATPEQLAARARSTAQVAGEQWRHGNTDAAWALFSQSLGLDAQAEPPRIAPRPVDRPARGLAVALVLGAVLWALVLMPGYEVVRWVVTR